MVVEDADSGFCGAVVEWDRATLTLEDRRGRHRLFPWAQQGFVLDRERVTLERPVTASPIASRRTASGSVAVHASAETGSTGLIRLVWRVGIFG